MAYIDWEDLFENWEDVDQYWNDVRIIEEVVAHINTGIPPEQAVNKLKKEDKKRFITLTIEVLGDRIVQKKQKKKIKLSSSDITLAVNELATKFNVTVTVIKDS